MAPLELLITNTARRNDQLHFEVKQEEVINSSHQISGKNKTYAFFLSLSPSLNIIIAMSARASPHRSSCVSGEIARFTVLQQGSAAMPWLMLALSFPGPGPPPWGTLLQFWPCRTGLYSASRLGHVSTVTYSGAPSGKKTLDIHHLMWLLYLCHNTQVTLCTECILCHRAHSLFQPLDSISLKIAKHIFPFLQTEFCKKARLKSTLSDATLLEIQKGWSV